MSTIFIPFTLNFGLIGLQVLNVRIVHCVKFVVFFFCAGGAQEYYHKDG